MEYEVIIGLEVHVQVRTATKMFCRCPNQSLAPPNTLVCPVCLGYPGVLPTPNVEAIRKTVLAGMLCGCTIAPYSKFDRKSYWYPDMPKNYQISQYDLPLCTGGHIHIEGKALTGEVAPRDIGLTRIHLEEDVAKSTHFAAVSGIDFNRAGVPLMEVVGEPELRTPDEAYAYLVALRQLMQYAEIGDCNMEMGQLRCDVNISLRPRGQAAFNPKTEIKNLGSIKAVHHSLQHEIERQTEALDRGEALVQTTRAWDDARGVTFVLRTKEQAHDYRYFPEPDLMPLALGPELLAEIRATLPETPAARRQRFVSALGLSEYDAHVLALEKESADYFEACVAAGAPAKTAANWIMTELLRELAQSATPISQCPIKPGQLVALLGLIEKGTINGKIAKQVFTAMYQSGKDPAVIVREQGLVQIADEGAIVEFVRQAIAANPKPVQQYREGKGTALQFLVGQVMRLSKGKANPQKAAELLKAELDKG